MAQPTAPTMAETARSLAAMDLDGAHQPRVWIVPFDNELLVANLTGSYGPAIASIEGMEGISVERSICCTVYSS
jgi:hypothetical protein